MSLRIDTSEWISGALIIGELGLGVLGQNIPSTGASGPAYTYNDLSLPADNLKEICGRITTQPIAGTFYAYEDTSFTFSGAPNGVYQAFYQLYVDGVATGSPTAITLSVGNPSPLTGTLTITGYAPTVTRGTAGPNPNPGTGVLTITGYAPLVTQSGPAPQAVNPLVGTLTITGYAPTVRRTTFLPAALGTNALLRILKTQK